MYNGVAVVEIKVEEPAILEELADRHPHAIYFEAEFETVTHTEDTLQKVHTVLLTVPGVDADMAVDIINDLLNVGILFRERA